MNYPEALARNFPISTGVTEAAAKTVVGTRMKRAGTRFSQHRRSDRHALPDGRSLGTLRPPSPGAPCNQHGFDRRLIMPPLDMHPVRQPWTVTRKFRVKCDFRGNRSDLLYEIALALEPPTVVAGLRWLHADDGRVSDANERHDESGRTQHTGLHRKDLSANVCRRQATRADAAGAGVNSRALSDSAPEYVLAIAPCRRARPRRSHPRKGRYRLAASRS